LFKGGVLGEISMKDVDIGPVAQLCFYLLLGRRFVADQTDYEVLLVFRDLLEELELGWIRSRRCLTRWKADSLRFPWILR